MRSQILLATLLVTAFIVNGDGFPFTKTVHETVTPVTRDVAGKFLNPTLLPPSAHNIQYCCWFMEVTPGFEDCVRFEASLKDCYALAHTLLPKKQLELAHYTRPAGDIPKWFDPYHISNGTMGGKGYNDEPQIWIDEEHRIFYYFLTD